MNVNAYLLDVLRKKKMSPQDRQMALSLAMQLRPTIREWGGKDLVRIIPSGSYAKDTGVKGTTDIDLLVSLRNQAPYTVEEIYNSLHDYLSGFVSVRKQNVSIRVKYRGKNIDLVPAKRMPNAIYPHSIWVSKKDTWTKTNIQKQIATVRNSGRRKEIVLMKIWRELNGLDFPSFYLELSVIEALKGKGLGNLENNIITVFAYLMKEFQRARIVDPANSQNVVSDDLSAAEKQKISRAASDSFMKALGWINVIR